MNATKYEVINKVTEEVTAVDRYETGAEGLTVHLPDGTPLLFTRINEGGNELDLENADYAIRIVDTHEELDGTGTVEVTEAGIVTNDTGAEDVALETVTIETTTETVAEEVAPTVTQ